MAAKRPKRTPKDYFYGEILRLPPGVDKPDYYTLLGVPFFESDHDEIVRAALDRIRLLEACEADPRPAYQRTCEALLARVKRAQLTLLDRRRRKVYDARLIGRSDDEQEQAEQEDDAELELPPGTMFLGRYRVMGEERRGGLGVVYDAMDSNMRSRVHLSVLRPRLSREKTPRRRIERAARAAAALDHPGILRVDEVGDADGLLYVRTRAPEGRNLLELIEGTPRMRVASEQARPVLQAVAEALAYAHRAGVPHGDLRPSNVFVDVSGRVLVADFSLSRAVADSGDAPPSPYRAPEPEATPAADLFALGAVAYQVLSGIPPFKAGAPRTGVPPLPEDVPEDLEVAVMRLLSREPEKRLASAEEAAARFAVAPAHRRRLPVLIGLAAVLVVALVAALFGRGTEAETPEPLTLQSEAWRLIADRDFDPAIAKLREGLAKTPDDPDLGAALARALTGKAQALDKGGDPWEAQRLLAEALATEEDADRREAFERVRAAAIARLAALAVEAEAVTARPAVRIEFGDVPVVAAKIGDTEMPAPAPAFEAALDRLPDGAYEIPFALEDAAGNRREGLVPLIVDRVPPEVEFVEPEDGALLRDGSIRVVVLVRDENPPETVLVRGRRVPVVDGEAKDRFDLGDGEHVFDVEATDRAGHPVTVRRTVVVDSKAPDLSLERKGVATRGGPVTVRGRVTTPGASVTVDGEPAGIAEDGSFAHDVAAQEDRLVVVEAVGPTGIRKRLSFQILVDAEPPELAVVWERRTRDGRLLYGSKEMDAGALALPLVVKERTSSVMFEAAEGEVADGVWRLAPHEGVRTVSLFAVDEAGNRAELTLEIEGHRATPSLDVKNGTKPFTNDGEAVLDVETDSDLLVQGEPTEPGRIRLALAEGKHTLLVQALDHYGNETRWEKVVVVDRTPPVLELLGGEARGIGRQQLEIKANEPLASVTCVGKTFDVNAEVARITVDLQLGRKSLHVVARDLAGNVTKEKFPLTVRNRVLELDGKSGLFVALPPPGREFTVEAWVRGVHAPFRSVLLAKTWARDYRLLWSKGEDPLPSASLVVGGAGTLDLPAKKAWDWDDWTHLALSCDGKRARFYVDGSQQAVADLEGPLWNGKDELFIGFEKNSRGGSYSWFRGALDELRVSDVARYSRGFTPAKFHREDDHTLLLLRFDAMQGEQHLDSSGRGLHATAVGRPRLADADR